MDVSPSWWLKARINEDFLKEYVFEKFDPDYYPRVINRGLQEIDLDKSGLPIKEYILELLHFGEFEYEFLPEDKDLKDLLNIK